VARRRLVSDESILAGYPAEATSSDLKIDPVLAAGDLPAVRAVAPDGGDGVRIVDLERDGPTETRSSGHEAGHTTNDVARVVAHVLADPGPHLGRLYTSSPVRRRRT